jgi:hypothetical protein
MIPYHVRLAISQFDEYFRVELFTEDLGDTNGDLVSAKVWEATDAKLATLRESSFRSWMGWLTESAPDLPVEAGEDLGKMLFKQVLGQEEISQKWSEVLQKARDQGKTLRVLIDATADEVNDLPFGLLYHPHDGAFLFRQEESRIQFVRILRRCTPRPLNLDRQPLRILLAAAEPTDTRAVDSPHWLRTLAGALTRSARYKVFLCSTDNIITAADGLARPVEEWKQLFCQTSARGLKTALQQGDFDVLHLMAHGYQGGLALCDAEGKVDLVAKDDLGKSCRANKEHPLELAFLQVCEASQTKDRGSFGGVAQQLLNPQGGNLAAVVASSYPVHAGQSTEAAITFYQRIASPGKDEGPDAALVRDLDLKNWAWAFLELWVRPGALGNIGTRGTFQFPRPYRGLAHFEEGNEDIFFGRAAQVEDLWASLNKEPVIAVVGNSGSGKSSLLHAGLIPRVRRKGLAGEKHWRILALQPGPHPGARLLAALTVDERGPTSAGVLPQDWASSLREVLSKTIQEHHLLLVLDQFEQLFTLCQDPAQCQGVAGALAEVLQAQAEAAGLGPERFRLVLGMRSEYLTAALGLPGSSQLIKRPWVPEAPSPDDIRTIIQGPAELYGYEFQGPVNDDDPRHQQRLLDRILGEPLLAFRTARSGIPAAAAPSTAPPLPLVEFALERLWLMAVNRGDREFTHADYEELGGLGGAIARHAEEVYQFLPTDPDLGPESTHLAEQLFTGLISSRGTKRPRPRSELAAATDNPPLAQRVIDRLVGERLLTVRSAPESLTTTQVEIAHEVLIDRWSTLKNWLNKDREGQAIKEAFQEDAVRWDWEAPGMPRRSPKSLPGPHQAKRYLRWIDVQRPDLSPVERAFANALRVSPRIRLRGVGGDIVDLSDITEVGWAVVYPANTPQPVKDALQPLVTRRRSQAGERCKILDYRPGETWLDWLIRHGVYPGQPVLTKVPHYLLLVGDPTLIPFESQYLLAVEYAVGRLAFDSPDDYANYAESVVAYETASAVATDREIVYWGPRHAGDRYTELTADTLLERLTHQAPGPGEQPAEPAIAEALLYRSRPLSGSSATKATLAEVLHAQGPSAPPAMLVAAAQGLRRPRGDPRQQSEQGALLCQDWPGFGPRLPGHYFGAADIRDDARLHGMVVFLFADFGAGTPAFDNFLIDRSLPLEETKVADQPFIAALPQQLLSQPLRKGGGALAVIGHIDQSWGYSIVPPGAEQLPVPFRNFIGRILSGEPVGSVTSELNERCAVLSMGLLEDIDEMNPARHANPEDLVWRRRERIDVRNFILLGDPAVQIRVELLR